MSNLLDLTNDMATHRNKIMTDNLLRQCWRLVSWLNSFTYEIQSTHKFDYLIYLVLFSFFFSPLNYRMKKKNRKDLLGKYVLLNLFDTNDTWHLINILFYCLMITIPNQIKFIKIVQRCSKLIFFFKFFWHWFT